MFNLDTSITHVIGANYIEDVYIVKQNVENWGRERNNTSLNIKVFIQIW